MSCDLYRVKIFSDDLSVVGSLFQMIGAAPEKARLLRLSLIVRTESCFKQLNRINDIVYVKTEFRLGILEVKNI